MSKKIVQTCDCDITKRMIEEGIIRVRDNEKGVFIMIAVMGGGSIIYSCPKCGKNLKIEEEKEKERKEKGEKRKEEKGKGGRGRGRGKE